MLTGGLPSLSYGVPPVPHLLARQVAAPGTWRHQPGSSGHLPCGANRSLRSVPRSAPVHAVTRSSASTFSGLKLRRAVGSKLQTGSRQRGVMSVAVSAPSKSVSASTSTTLWDTTFRLHNVVKTVPLKIQIKDADTGKLSPETDVSSWERKKWDRTSTGDGDGTLLVGKLPLGDVRNPGAALVQYFGPESTKQEDAAKQLARVFVSDITLSSSGMEDAVIMAQSWVNRYHTQTYGPRVFFKAQALLPKDTPQALKDDRKQDLAIIQGTDSKGVKIASAPRKPADRIEDYALYNDLGSPKEQRPVLGGGAAIDGFPYPRRIATNRGLNEDNKTEVAPKDLPRWIPADDNFTEAKEAAFGSSTSYAAFPLIAQQLKRAVVRLGPVGFFAGIWAAVITAVFRVVALFRGGLTEGIAGGGVGGFWSSFKEILTIYSDTEGKAEIPEQAKLGRTDSKGKAADLTQKETNMQVYQAVNDLPRDDKVLLLARAGISQADFDSPDPLVPKEKYQQLAKSVDNHLDWPEPYVIAGYHSPPTDSDGPEGKVHPHDNWKTDEEFGRQYKAGANPLVLAALKDLPDGSALRGKLPLINSLLDPEDTVEKLTQDVRDGKPPRIFIVDYEQPLVKTALNVNGKQKDRCMYAGRALLYERSDSKLVPVAIELHAPEGDPATGVISKDETTVYTRKDPKQIWWLAKAAFNTIDSGVHQLVSHWLRTHACVEPYIISTDRNFSQMHPLYKLLQPHLQYTYRINADARTVLIAADKIVELVFTPGTYCMQLSADAYASWRFEDQCFAGDVLKRGLAKRGKTRSSVDIIAQDYPWAEDGKLIWDALHTYINDYVELYYKNDQDIASDGELQNWWEEIKTKGHPDVAEGWPELSSVEDLSYILSAIAWTASAHHAAVNFGQADYSSFVLNRSSLLRKPIPAPGDRDYKALTEGSDAEFQKEFLRYIANQLPASIVIAVMEILSTHAASEHYLIDSNQNYITDKDALAVHGQFLKDLQAAENTINARNTSGQSKARTPADGGLPYQLLIPRGIGSKGEALDMENNPGNARVINKPGRGIPFSISI